MKEMVHVIPITVVATVMAFPYIAETRLLVVARYSNFHRSQPDLDFDDQTEMSPTKVICKYLCV